MLNAVILAGDNKNPLIDDGECKALMKIGDRCMVEFVVDSLIAAGTIDKIVIVGPSSLKKVLGGLVSDVIESKNSMVENLKMGIEYFNGDSHLIVCTSDIPLLSGEAVDDFVNQCINEDVDIGYPIIDKSLNDAKYPDVKRTYVKLKEGTYTGGNIIYVNPSAIKKCYPVAEELTNNRKNAFKLAKIFGFLILIKLVFGRLKITTVEKRVRTMFGINVKAIKTSYPEIGNDVDKIEDVDFVNKYMNLGA